MRQGRSVDQISKAKQLRITSMVAALLMEGEAAYCAYNARTVFAPHSLASGRFFGALNLDLAIVLVVNSLAFWISSYVWGRYLRSLQWTRAASWAVRQGIHNAPATPSQPAAISAEQTMPGTMTFGPFARSWSQNARLNLVAGLILLFCGLLISVFLGILFSLYLATDPSLQIPLLGTPVTEWMIVVAACVIWMSFDATTGLQLVRRARRGLVTDRIIADERALILAPGNARKPRTPLAAPTLGALQARYLAGALIGLLGLVALASLAAGVPLRWVAGGAGVCVLAFTLGALIRRSATTAHRRGEATRTGLWPVRRSIVSIKQSSSPAPIAWSHIRGFFLLDHWRGIGVEYAIYGVHTGTRLLTWAIASNAREAVLTSHDTLCRLIVTRTGLALRDVSAVVNQPY